MKIALKAAKKAFENDEVPIGAVLVEEGQIIEIGWNRCEEYQSQMYHAELVALGRKKDFSGKRVVIYVTHEPCPMCLGALIESGIKEIVYGAPEPRWGCLGGVLDLKKKFDLEVRSGVLEKECIEIIQNFFKMRRKR